MTYGRIALICMMVGFFCTALIGQGHLFGDTVDHVITVVGLIGSNIASVMFKFQKDWNGVERREQ